MSRRSEVRRIIRSRLETHVLEPLEQRCLATVAQGPEFLVNTWTVDVQATNPAAAISSDDEGNFVTVWESLNRESAGSYGIYGQRFMADGTPVGAEFLVSSTVLSDQRMPAVSMNAYGAFVVAWEGQVSLSPTYPGIYVQRYDAGGVALDTEIAVAGTLQLSANEAAVAMNASGAFIVVWEENGPEGRDIAARIFDADGSPMGEAFTVNQTTAGNQRQPQLVMVNAGYFAVTWNGNGIGDDAGVFARLFGPTGTPLTDEVLLNTTTTGTQSFSAIARDGNGEFIVVWSGNGTGDTAGVFARRMTPAGVPTASEFRISGTTTGTQQRPSVAFDPHGEYVVSWSGFGGPDTSGIYAREYWSNDIPKAAEYPLNTTTAGIQINASVASTGDNGYVVAWHGPGAGDTAGVFGRLLANSAPTISTTGWNVSYTEDGTPVVVDSALEVSDADSLIASATVQISLNFAPSEDSLVFIDQLGITGSWDPVTGILTLTGTAPSWDYQTALRSVAYLNSSQSPSAGVREIVFAVSDGSVGSTAPANGVTVTPVHDAPVVRPSGVTAAFVEDGGSVAVDPWLGVIDFDSAMLTGATVQITDNFVAAQDSLLFEDQLGITGSWNPVTGLLTLTGMASVADYQTALRSARYTNSSQDPVTLSRTVAFIVSDGIDLSSAALCTVGVMGMNEAPVVSMPPGGPVYLEDAPPVALHAGLGLSDADSATIVSATLALSQNYVPGEDSLAFTNQAGITGTWDAVAGALTLSGIATVSQYEAALRSVGYVNYSQNPSGLMRTVTISVSDGVDASEPVSQVVSVTPVNDAPGAVGSSGHATYTEGGAAVPVDSGVVLSDVDSAMLSSAVLRISGNFAPGEDSLVFDDQAGITGVWDASSGTLTLSGAASVAAYQGALRSVRYRNTSTDPSTTERIVTTVVMDDAGTVSATVSRSIEVEADSAPPPTKPPAPTPPCPSRPPCFYTRPAPPVVKPPCAPSVTLPCKPAGRSCKVPANLSKATMHCADVIVRIVGERLDAKRGGPACRVVVEVLKGSPKDAICTWISVRPSALTPEAARHERLVNDGKHPACQNRNLDNCAAVDERRGPSHAGERSTRAEEKGRCGAEDRGGSGRGRGR